MKRLLNIDFALVQAIYWMLYTVAGSFVSVLLLEKDYTNASIGTIIAVGSVLAILLQTVITHVTDRSSRLDSIGMIKILTLLLAAGVFAVLLIGEKSAALTIAYVGVIILAYRHASLRQCSQFQAGGDGPAGQLRRGTEHGILGGWRYQLRAGLSGCLVPAGDRPVSGTGKSGPSDAGELRYRASLQEDYVEP